MKKVKRYNGEEGSSVELPDYEREPSLEDKGLQGAAVAQYKVDKGMNPNVNEDMTFKERFAQARKDGDKTFEWHGKKYTTELAKPKAKAKDNAAVRSHSKMNAMGDTFKSGGSVSASRRGDGIAQRGKTRGRIC